VSDISAHRNTTRCCFRSQSSLIAGRYRFSFRGVHTAVAPPSATITWRGDLDACLGHRNRQACPPRIPQVMASSQEDPDLDDRVLLLRLSMSLVAFSRTRNHDSPLRRMLPSIPPNVDGGQAGSYRDGPKVPRRQGTPIRPAPALSTANRRRLGSDAGRGPTHLNAHREPGQLPTAVHALPGRSS
jgi:hypothetical protein